MDYPIQTIQPMYYVAEDFKSAGDILVRFGEFLPRPFKTYYDRTNESVKVDRKIRLVQVEEDTLDFWRDEKKSFNWAYFSSKLLTIICIKNGLNGTAIGKTMAKTFEWYFREKK